MIRKISITLASAMVVVACATSPLGNKQLKLFPETEMNQMGAMAFSEMKEKQKLATNKEQIALVECVSVALINELPDSKVSDWEIQVFEEDSANAFALPGGKVGVHTGLLEVATSPSQLAAVIGHELAHVRADHSNARMSTAYATQAGLQFAQVLAGEPTETKQQIFGLLGLGAQVGVILPYGRKQETEADLLGLDIMAKAGFEPEESVQLWKNMSAASGGSSGPGFLSTHPNPEDRIKKLQKRMDKAKALQAQALAAGKKPNC